jgi:FlaA1/EpsC-like NDP-sugar epimerase
VYAGTDSRVDRQLRLALVFLQRRITADALAWVGGLAAATAIRYDFDLTRIDLEGLAVFVAVAAALQVLVGILTGLYLGRWRLGSFDEVSALGRTSAEATAVLVVADLVGPRFVPLSAVFAGGIIAFVLMGAARYLIRSREQQRRRPTDARRLVVLGAGEAGAQITQRLLRDPASPWIPVALLDDDPMKRQLRICGVPVVGTRFDLTEVALAADADAVLVAIPSADAVLIREVSDLAQLAGVELKVLPPVSELIDGHLTAADIRTPTMADLLGRREIETDLGSIASYLTGKRVLVTGAGGSIGSELCRQIAKFAPASLIMVDRDESALHAVQLSVEGKAMLDSPDVVLLDLRDRIGMARLMHARQPDVVFHAAALKHLPLLERHPGEAVKANVWVTANLLALAADVGVQQFVNISTDKAADPTSVLGYSKRIGERLTAHFAQRAAGTFMSVRFGNVLGSRGSVIPAWQAQIAAGGPVTVTHPDITRFFMTIEEAVQLVIQAGVVGRPGEVLVLDMGEPVRLDDVARRLIELSGADVEIEYTGMREGEKLHEVLFSTGEDDHRPVHPLISHTSASPLAPETVQMLDPTLRREDVIDDLVSLCDVSADDAMEAVGIAMAMTGGSDDRTATVDTPDPHQSMGYL